MSSWDRLLTCPTLGSAVYFDAEFSVDIFQILAALLIPVDLTSEILKKLKRAQQMKGSS